MTGFVAAQRSLIEHHLFEGDASRLGAWVWLFLRAAWKPTPFDVSGKTITIERGQLCVSRAQLAKAWGWSPSAVERFLTRLQTEQMIERATGQGRTIITICNYDKYQSVDGKPGQATGQATGQRSDSDRTTKEQGNKETIEEPNGSSPPTPQHTRMRDWPEIPDWIPVDQWNAFIAMRKRKARGSMPTARAIELIIGKLDRWRASGQDPGAILDQSTEGQWTGIFELKEQENGRSGAGKSSGGSRVDRRDSYSRAIQERAGIGTFAFDAETPE